MLIVDLSQISMIDLSGAYALEDLIKSVQANNIKVYVSNAKPKIKEILEQINFIEHIGINYYKDSKDSIIPIILDYYPLKKQEGTNSQT
jgi:anti-anti-sigma regulatory factor